LRAGVGASRLKVLSLKITRPAVPQRVRTLMHRDKQDTFPGRDLKPERIRWLPPLVLLVNLAVFGVLSVYSALNLRPYVSSGEPPQFQIYHHITLYLIALLPTTASTVYLWPVFVWLRRAWTKGHGGEAADAPSLTAARAANAPAALAAFSFVSWILVEVQVVGRIHAFYDRLTLGMWAHFIIRPLLAGLIAAVAVFFAAEYVCRRHAWPTLLATTRIEGNPRLWKIRVSHRLLLLWGAISFLPLSAVVMIAFIGMDRPDLPGDSLLLRIMFVIMFIAVSAALGGAALAWLVARAMGRSLRALERAMARLRGGDFSVRVPVTATDEIGALAEGFNLSAERLAKSYEALEARNRELAGALDRVAFLESVKRGLDRFVPDTVRRAIEENPDTHALDKKLKDVTVLFLDIEGYSRLSEELPREELNGLVEGYFSLFLSRIRAEGGDINETAGDGLMILFQAGRPDEHAAAAVRTALAIREKMVVANREARKAHPPICVNIGISSGECLTGSTRLQSALGERWTFTASGPVTNLAARLGDRAIKGQILLGPETARRVGGQFRLHTLGPLSLKNIARPIEVWEVVDEAPCLGGDAAAVETRETGDSGTVKRTQGNSN
jgi:class 3 adenylate cyclase/HAMP domain-containing protein